MKKSKMDKTSEESAWDNYWKKATKQKSFLGSIFTLYRIHIISRGVKFYFEKYLPKKGTFIECGSGSSQSSIRIKRYERKLIALDVSLEALKEAKKIPIISKTIKSDIRDIPFKDKSIDGIWNLGVMEHFSKKDINKILCEFKRVLKDDGTLLLFWPVTYSPNHIFFESIIKISKIFGKKINFFPSEPSILHSKNEAKEYLKKAGFKSEEFFNWRDGFTHIVIVAKKE